MIYFDNSATTWPKPEIVYKKADELSRNFAFNAGRGNYKASQHAQDLLDIARAAIAELGNSKSEDVYFSASATEALNQIIFGSQLGSADNVYVSPFEHNAIIRPLTVLDVNLIQIPFDSKDWQPDSEKIEMLFKKYPPKAVFLSEVSNVTGYKLPWQTIFGLAEQYGAIRVLDASQSFGLVDSDYENLDYLVFNGHKSLYGIMGAAGFIKYSNCSLFPYIYGGTGSDSLSGEMPKTGSSRFEAGTHNLPAVAVLIDSISWLSKQSQEKKKRLTEKLITELEKIDGIHLYLPPNGQTEGIVSFNLGGYSSSELAEILDQDFDIAVRSGYHCAPLVHDFIGSHDFLGTVRVSLGFFNTEAEVDQLIEALETLSEELG